MAAEWATGLSSRLRLCAGALERLGWALRDRDEQLPGCVGHFREALQVVDLHRLLQHVVVPFLFRHDDALAHGELYLMLICGVTLEYTTQKIQSIILE